MAIFKKIALFFVVLFSVIMIINTYIGDSERVQSNFFYLFINGFAYIVSAMELDKDKLILKTSV